jgi:hypothetical protein
MLGTIFEGYMSIILWPSMAIGILVGFILFYGTAFGLPVAAVYFTYKKIKSLTKKDK